MTRYQISGSIIAMLGVLIFFVVPYQVESVQSGTFPKVISACLMVFGVLVVLTSGKEKKPDDVKLTDPLLLSYMGLVFVAVVLIRVVGFYPAILIALPLCLVLFGERNPKKIILFTLITTGMIYLIIDLLLGSMLP